MPIAMIQHDPSIQSDVYRISCNASRCQTAFLYRMQSILSTDSHVDQHTFQVAIAEAGWWGKLVSPSGRSRSQWLIACPKHNPSRTTQAMTASYAQQQWAHYQQTKDVLGQQANYPYRELMVSPTDFLHQYQQSRLTAHSVSRAALGEIIALSQQQTLVAQHSVPFKPATPGQGMIRGHCWTSQIGRHPGYRRSHVSENLPEAEIFFAQTAAAVPTRDPRSVG